MRRAAALVLGTLAGTGLLVGAKIGNTAIGGPAVSGATGISGVIVTGSSPTTGGPTAPAQPGATAASRATHGASTPAAHPTTAGPPAKPTTPASKPAPGTATATPAPTPAPPTAASGPKDGTYQASSTEHYGTLTLTVTISGHKITDIGAHYASNSPSYCTRKACPKLRSEVLTAQSADVATVSGATYTSDAYLAALAAVLKSAA